MTEMVIRNFLLSKEKYLDVHSEQKSFRQGFIFYWRIYLLVNNASLSRSTGIS